MDITKVESFFQSLVQCLNKDRKKVKNLFLAISKIFSNPSSKLFAELIRDFPSLRFLQWVKEQVPDLILLCAPLGTPDQVDGPMTCLSKALNAQTFGELLSEALSNAEQTKLLSKSLGQLALQLPKIGIAELLVSSPLFPTSVQSPMCTSGMTATLSKECADVDYLHLSEKETLKTEYLQPDEQSLDTGLCEANPPKKRAKMETPISKDYSSIFKFLQSFLINHIVF